jgi:hypothetical protein
MLAFCNLLIKQSFASEEAFFFPLKKSQKICPRLNAEWSKLLNPQKIPCLGCVLSLVVSHEVEIQYFKINLML